jgi:hypothetical protein
MMWSPSQAWTLCHLQSCHARCVACLSDTDPFSSCMSDTQTAIQPVCLCAESTHNSALLAAQLCYS